MFITAFLVKAAAFPVSIPLPFWSQAFSYYSSRASPLKSSQVAWSYTGREAATPSQVRVVQVDAADVRAC